jgi:hypothetical protein
MELEVAFKIRPLKAFDKNAIRRLENVNFNLSDNLDFFSETILSKLS